MKLVHFADLHLDAQFGAVGMTDRGASARRQALRDALVQIVDLARQVNADALLCAGDLYEHERCSPDTAAFLHATFADCQPLPVYIAPGNHDWLEPSSVYERTTWSPNVHIFRSTALEPITLADGLKLWGAAHRAPANTPGFLEHFRVDRGGVHIALFHGAEQGWAPTSEEAAPHAPFREQQIEVAGIHHAFIGHYHAPRHAKRYTYPGNPAPLVFGEDGERGAVVSTIQPDGTVLREHHRVTSIEVHDLVVDVTGCTSQQDVRTRVSSVTRGLRGYARVTVSGELAPDVDLRTHHLTDAAPALDALVVRVGDIRVGYDIETICSEPTVRGQFVRDVLAAPGLTAEQSRRVLQTGLRALDGRSDLEIL